MMVMSLILMDMVKMKQNYKNIMLVLYPYYTSRSFTTHTRLATVVCVDDILFSVLVVVMDVFVCFEVSSNAPTTRNTTHHRLSGRGVISF